ncbi:uncharacterized protein [Typha angustifolia]|uniref:uncharacterized protein n=1 Tax=Typha angustifolia TaxID=59011 RepID=UPI003C2EB24F
MPSLQRLMDVEQDPAPKVLDDYLSNTRSELLSILHANSERNNKAEAKIAWLQSQIIGSNLEFETPFGKRLLTYADHTASGRSLHYLENYIIQEVLPIYGNTHTDDSFVGIKTTRMVNKASEYIKQCLGGGPDDALIFCGSGSSAAIKRLQEVMGITVASIMRDQLVQSLKDEERWVVFVGPYEHHSNLLSWRQSSAEVIEIGLDENGLLDMEALKLELTSPKHTNRPMLGSFSACSNVTGMLTDTHALASLLHQHGAFACFDFATSGPYVEIAMRSGDIEGYDAIFLSPHKFIGGPGTPGILLMSKALYQLRSSPPSTCGGGVVAYVNGYNEKDTLYLDDIERREDPGTPPIIQKIRAALAFWVKEYIGYNFINLQEHAYAEAALRRLLTIPNIIVLGNSQVKRLPIFSFLVLPNVGSSCDRTRHVSSSDAEGSNKNGKFLHGRFVAKLLNDLFGVQARGGCSCAGPYGHHLLGVEKAHSLHVRSYIQEGYTGLELGWTRVSFPYYMNMEEFAFILDSIEFIAMYGRRFLPLYHFNWVTGEWTFRKSELESHLMKANIGRQGERSRPANIEKLGKKYSWTIETAQRYESYLESARKIALSLPEEPGSRRVPDGIDPRLVIYHI